MHQNLIAIIVSAKVKLDLYNKRFNVYVTALDLYQAIWRETHENINKKAIEFTKSYRESQFLFDKKDGIYAIFGEIQQNAGRIYGYEEAKSNGSDTSALLHVSIKAREEFESNLKILEQKLDKYIQFKTVAGW